MKTRKWILLASLIVTVVAVLALAPAVLAQGPRGGFGSGNGGKFADDPTGLGYGHGPQHGAGFGGRMGSRWGGPEQSLTAVAAEVLGMTQRELVAELQTGQTIAQVAENNGVTLDVIVDAFLAPRTEQLAERVAAGQLTQAQVDLMLANMTANVTTHLLEAWSPRGYGPGVPGNNFTDQDGDGVCDYMGTGQLMQRHGRWGQ